MILRTEGLSKTFEVGLGRRRVEAVQDLTLSVAEGEIFGFVGPNGAGKTTTIKMLMGLIHPTRGKGSIFEAPIPTAAAKARIGYLPEHPAYYDFLTGREALHLFARIAGVSAGELPATIEKMLRAFLKHRTGSESYQQFTLRHEVGKLQELFAE